MSRGRAARERVQERLGDLIRSTGAGKGSANVLGALSGRYQRMVCRVIGHRWQPRVSGGELCLRCRLWRDTWQRKP